MRFEDRREPVELSHERIWTGPGPALSQQLADLAEDSSDQGVVFCEAVDHRGKLGRGGAQCGQDLTVLTGVMGLDRGAEAEGLDWSGTGRSSGSR